MSLNTGRYPTVREAQLYEKLTDEQVRCGVCHRRCLVKNNRTGFCKTRFNRRGTLYTMVYGDISALDSRSIELKPFFHYYPGSTALTFSTWSCNFTCPWCQNHHLSKRAPNPLAASYITPDDLVKMASSRGDEGTCVSFTEPTLLFEYSLDVFRMASARGLYNSYVSNGYLSQEALTMLAQAGLNAINIDVKGGAEVYTKYCGGVDVDAVWNAAQYSLTLNLHVEIVHLVIPGVNDDEGSLHELVERHLRSVGGDTPLHFTRYFPAFSFQSAPTDIRTLEGAYTMAKDAGVYYPYIGNVPGHHYEDTHCPSCDALLVERHGHKILHWGITEDNACPKCGFVINIKGRYVDK